MRSGATPSYSASYVDSETGETFLAGIRASRHRGARRFQQRTLSVVSLVAGTVAAHATVAMAAGMLPASEAGQHVETFAALAAVALGVAFLQRRFRRRLLDAAATAGQSRAALEVSERRFRMVTETAPVLLWLTDRDGAVTFVNDGWLEFSGQPPESLLGNGWTQLVHPDERMRMFTSWRAAFEARRRFVAECRFRRIDGEYRWLLSTGVPRVDPEEGFAGYAGSCVDVTEQRRASADRERFFTLSLDMLTIGDFDGRLLRLNAAWERTLGHRVDDMQGRPFLDFVHVDDHAASMAVMERLRAGNDLVAFENRYRCRDGSYRWMSWRATTYPDERLIYAAARDVTAEKEAAVALAAACDRALEGARIKSQFLADIGHEIRTPMNGVIGMTDLALGTELTPEQREYLEVVRSSAAALLRLMNDVLDLSRTDAGRLRLEPMPFAPRDHLLDAVKPLAAGARTKGLALFAEVGPEVPTTVVGDPGRIRQVLLNLLVNGVKFTAAGEVAVRHDVVETRAHGVVLEYTVRDTGIGVAAEQHGAIFEALEQADASTTRRAAGKGRGLAISRQLVELMGGTLWMRSAAGTGTTFGFTVPVRRGVAIALEVEPDAAARRARSGVRVLLVDDDAANRLLAVRVLEEHGHTVETVDTGRAAVGAMAERPFDVVLMDVEMPDLDGPEATKAIRARERGVAARVPIIALTAQAVTGDRERCIGAGMDAYLAKPAAAELLATIDRLVRRAPEHPAPSPSDR